MNVDLSISIITGGNPQLVLDCLSSLYASFDGSLICEVWVVDNVCEGDLVDRLSALYPNLRIIRNARRKGFGANHNQVLRQAAGRYILLLNDDTIVTPAACEKLVAAADANPEAGIFGPRLLNKDLTLQPSVYRFPSVWLSFIEAFGLDRLLHAFPRFDIYRAWPHDSARTVDFVSGAAFLIRKEVVEEVGLFDENFFMYAEETDLCLRASKKGWRVAFVPDSEIIHLGGQSTVALNRERTVEILRSQSYFMRKHSGTTALAMYKIFCLLKHLPRWLFKSLSGSQNEAVQRDKDTTLWSIGLLRHPGLQESLKDRPGS